VLTGGTSASAPIVGSIISLVNEQRIKAGKGPVGPINPVLYANPWALNDIVEGGKPGCGTNGFNAVEGWNPVSGLSWNAQFREAIESLDGASIGPKGRL
jgi:tripeptidyl-peptidase-1